MCFVERKLWRIFSKYLTAMCYLIFLEWKHFLIEDFQISKYFPNVLLPELMTFFKWIISKSFPAIVLQAWLGEIFICLSLLPPLSWPDIIA